MYEFLDRFVNVALPRVRDFRGISPRGFDGRGKARLGVKEQIIFPEIEYDKIDALRGMDITFTTTAKTDDEAKALLAAFPFPLPRLTGTAGQKWQNSPLSIANKNVVTSSPSTPRSVPPRPSSLTARPVKKRMQMHAPNSGAARNSNPTRLRNRCELTGRPRCVQSKFGLARHRLRELIFRGGIPGLTKAELVRDSAVRHVRSHRRYVDPHSQCAGHGRRR